ncbi:MAG: hypothetical protein AAGE93_13365 [Bacteroidota bacterium]
MNSTRVSLLGILAAIPLIWIISAIYGSKEFDLQLHDTYLVVHSYVFAEIFTIGLVRVLGLYYILSRDSSFLNHALTTAHAIVVLTTIILLGVLFHFLTTYDDIERYSSDLTFVNYLASIVIILIILSVVIFIINSLLGLIQRVIKRKAV